MADKQYQDALKALRVIERECLPAGKYLTYGSLAKELEHAPSKYARHVGQVCSLIDAACYWARLPMLSLEKVRMDDGAYNPDSVGGEFAPVKAQLIENAAKHPWSSEDIARIQRTLGSHMNGEGAVKHWKKISGFGEAGVKRLASYR